MNKNSDFNTRFFNIAYKQNDKRTEIEMHLSLPFVSTKYIPDTKSYLQKYNPTVLNSQCFNDSNLPFHIEVQETEIGHLFEHILLDQLCLTEIESGALNSSYSGRTYWNWQKNPYGTFFIKIDLGKENINLLLNALNKTVILMENLIYTSNNIGGKSVPALWANL